MIIVANAVTQVYDIRKVVDFLINHLKEIGYSYEREADHYLSYQVRKILRSTDLSDYKMYWSYRAPRGYGMRLRFKYYGKYEMRNCHDYQVFQGCSIPHAMQEGEAYSLFTVLRSTLAAVLYSEKRRFTNGVINLPEGQIKDDLLYQIDHYLIQRIWNESMDSISNDFSKLEDELGIVCRLNRVVDVG